MCGIAGIYRPDRGFVDPERAVKMRDAMMHRGPDDCGVSSGPGYALGHCRLSIIDLSSAGRQPMWNSAETVAVVFNGEIYNFMELRAELEAQGHVFKSRT